MYRERLVGGGISASAPGWLVGHGPVAVRGAGRLSRRRGRRSGSRRLRWSLRRRGHRAGSGRLLGRGGRRLRRRRRDGRLLLCGRLRVARLLEVQAPHDFDELKDDNARKAAAAARAFLDEHLKARK